MPTASNDRADGWHPGRALLSLKGGEQQEVAAYLLGTLAIHKDVTQPSLWSLTHGPSGLLLTTLPSMTDAQRIGRHLWANVRAAFSQYRPASVKARCPPWVRPWLAACTGRGGWVNPEEYTSAANAK